MRSVKAFAIFLVLSLYLGLAGDHLAIFSRADAKPLQILPYSVTGFPKSDKTALKNGIPFATPAELSKLLEDYTS